MAEKEKAESKNNLVEHTFFPAITSLVKPTTDYIGGEIKDAIKEKVETYKKKRREANIQGHLDQVSKRLKEENYQGENTVEQLNQFDEWVDSVENIEPDDRELSSLWQGLLHEIFTNKNTDSVILQNLKRINHKEAEIILKLEQGENFLKSKLSKEDKHHFLSLENKGLIEKEPIFYTTLKNFLFLGFFSIFVVFVMPYVLTNLGPEHGLYVTFSGTHYEKIERLKSLLTFSTLMFFALYALFILDRFNNQKYVLTWVGKQLAEIGQSQIQARPKSTYADRDKNSP